MNVLSLFDGMSCGQQALERVGVKVDNYFASEIDKHAIIVTMSNYPNTKQLGSVINVDGYKLPKIDLLLGGSPCQSFSFAGKRKGMATKCETEILTLEHYLELKSEGYEFEGQSYLFWEYMRLLNEVKPKYFLLENVEMGEKWEKVLNKAIGVRGIHINSSLVSAQNRRRIYWTNIGLVPNGLFGDLESIIQQPKDKGILLKDILETDVDEKYYLSDNAIAKCLKSEANKTFDTDVLRNKSRCLIAGYHKIPFDGQYIVHNTMPRSSTTGKGGTGPLSRTDGKTYCLDTGNTNAIEIKCVAQRGHGEDNEQTIEERKDFKTNALTSVQKDNLVKTACIKFGRTDEGKAMRKESIASGKDHTPFQAKEITGLDFEKMNTLVGTPGKDNLVMQLNRSLESGGKQPYQTNRIYDINGISPCLNTDSRSPAILKNTTIRRLTPTECERLQTVKDNYTAFVSDTQRYRMLGNGWTVDVVAYILGYI